jgi:hypothetical protein
MYSNDAPFMKKKSSFLRYTSLTAKLMPAGFFM